MSVYFNYSQLNQQIKATGESHNSEVQADFQLNE